VYDEIVINNLKERNDENRIKYKNFHLKHGARVEFIVTNVK